MSSKAESSKGVAATGNVTGAASRFPPAPHFTPPAASFDAATASPQTEKSPASSVGSYYPWLDVLRGASWIMVVIGHTLLRFQYVASMGVGIFFAISGWLITKIIIAQRESNAPLANFYTRRCLRILPLYAAVIIVTCTACYIFPGWKNFFPFLPDVGAPYQILPYLATFSSEYWRGGGGGMLVGHCWSLCVEERFYVFWPLILALCPNRVLSRRSLIVFAVAAWYLTLQKLSYDNVTAGLSFLPFPLLLGCGLAIFFPKARVTASNLLTIPLGFILLGLYVYYAHHKVVYAGFTIAAYSLHAGILAMGLVACGVLSRTDPHSRFWRLMQLLGKASYAAYLIHPIFTYIGIKIAIKTGHPELGPIVAVALCAPLGLRVAPMVRTADPRHAPHGRTLG